MFLKTSIILYSFFIAKWGVHYSCTVVSNPEVTSIMLAVLRKCYYSNSSSLMVINEPKVQRVEKKLGNTFLVPRKICYCLAKGYLARHIPMARDKKTSKERK